MKIKPYLPALVCACLWILLAVWIFSGGSAGFDESVGSAVRSLPAPFFYIFFSGLHFLFSVRGMVSVCIILLLLPVSRTKIGISASGALLISALFNTLLKNIFARPRPDIIRLVAEHGFSFPSGHSSAAAALSAAVIVTVFAQTKSRKARIVTCILCGLITFSVLASRVYLGVHFPSDCIAGAASGFAVGYTVSYVIQKLLHKKRKVL